MRYRTFDQPRNLERSLIPTVDRVLKSCDLELHNVDAFAVGLGPGSFTSLRVGLSAVKAFGLSTGKPVMGIPSLDTLAYSVRAFQGEIRVIMDARRSLVYSSRYVSDGSDIQKISEDVLCPIQDCLTPRKGNVLFVGDAVAMYNKDIEASRSRNFFPHFANDTGHVPHARWLGVLVFERYRDGQADDLHQLQPLYLYPEDCQVRK